MDQPARAAERGGGPSRPATRTALKNIHLDNLHDVRLGCSLGAKLRTAVHPSTWTDALYLLSKRNLFVAICLWWFSFLANIVLNLLFSPSSILLDPVSALTSLALYPVIGAILTFYAIVLTVFRLVGGGEWIETVGKRFAKGRSLPNWTNPDFLDDVAVTRALNEARAFLAGYVPTTVSDEAAVDDQNPAFAGLNTVRVFSTVLARALLTLSGAVYERSDAEVEEASNIYYNAKARLSSGEISTATFERERKRAEGALTESERKIRRLANKCHLEYDGVSDLATIGGCFASLFFTRPTANEAPFIVLVFKGTGVGNFSEFVTDMSFSRVPASSFFGPGSGTAHKGFFTSLFKSDARATGGDGYGSVVSALKHAAARIKEERGNSDESIPLWVTGHSLGSALALLAFTRFLKSPEDLGDDIELRDFYGFGTLRLGDADFVSSFENLTLSPRNRPNIAWRVQNRSDLATSFPFGVADVPQLRTILSTSSLINYGHVSSAVVLRPIVAVPGSTYRLDNVGSFRGATEVKVVTDPLGLRKAKPSDRMRPWWKDSARLAALYVDPLNPIRWGAALFGLVAPMIYDHAPSSYMHALNAIGKRTIASPPGEAAPAAVPARLEVAIETEESSSESSTTAEGFEVIEAAIEEAVEEAVQEVVEEVLEQVMFAAAAAAPAHAPAYLPVFITPSSAAGQAAADRAAREHEGEGEGAKDGEEQAQGGEVKAEGKEEKKEGDEEGAASYPSPPDTAGLPKDGDKTHAVDGQGADNAVKTGEPQQQEQEKNADAGGEEAKKEDGSSSSSTNGLPKKGF